MKPRTRTVSTAAATLLLMASAHSALAQESPKSAWRTAGHEIAASFRQIGHAAAVTAHEVGEKIHAAFSRHDARVARAPREQQQRA
ncbi:MAG TPA: hypothetical protein VMI92_11620 [Steroidobacteraceae bacterium]|nr:hypothetical protein [Steroidobacteraceae bacterium]